MLTSSQARRRVLATTAVLAVGLPLLLGVRIAVADPPANSVSTEKGGVLLRVSAPGSQTLHEHPLYESAFVTVTIQNNGDEEVSTTETQGLPDYRIQMKLIDRATGKNVEFTQAGKNFPIVELMQSGSLYLRKGEHKDWTIDLAEYVVLHRGDFRLTLSLPVDRVRELDREMKLIAENLDFSISD